MELFRCEICCAYFKKDFIYLLKLGKKENLNLVIGISNEWYTAVKCVYRNCVRFISKLDKESTSQINSSKYNDDREDSASLTSGENI